MKPILVIFCCLIAFLAGCDPISVSEPPLELYVPVEIRALVSPDTVGVSQPFTIQISFPNICAGKYEYLFVSYDTLNHFYLKPVLHQTVGQTCSGDLGVQTVSTTLHFSREGIFEIVAVGNNSNVKKQIIVLPTYEQRQTYTLSFLFRDRDENALPFQESQVTFSSLSPPSEFTIHADDYGVWDTTFTSALTSFNYSVSGYQFIATPGINENGIIVVP